MGLTPEQVEAELARHEQMEATLARLHPAFELTPVEQKQRQVTLQLEEAATWPTMVWRFITPIEKSYEHGDLAPMEALSLVRRISVACPLPFRLQSLRGRRRRAWLHGDHVADRP